MTIVSWFNNLFSSKNNSTNKEKEDLVVREPLDPEHENCNALLSEENQENMDETEDYWDSDPEDDPWYDELKERVAGTRYEKFVGKTTPYYGFEQLLSDAARGKKIVTVGYHSEINELADTRKFEIDAYSITSVDLLVLKEVFEAAQREAVSLDEDFDYEFEIIQQGEEIRFNECYDPYISSRNTVKGNMYDSNIDTYGAINGVKAIRSYLLYKTDTNEFIQVNGRYWCM
ncbi:hypothetical protein M5X00_23240 [Paenibacillus alvei]|uniref:Uncharacterized protein n=1 Tax=Paenibacillus alvei TaxID=44250 RepID=A0ABT4H7K6_PAEAL|nr:hypothetical protein [Paenibacillus alvei]EJW14321.1 hypothetical protein PAV_14c00140 [Paenibacillus alvei DSM 29]MCY9541872.1 hypothetical protein [Paenibacillus alvei]MCY9737307.1 hypothetical protein [Paenibacillus alvei]MCY9757157.1 hypothetical protein [Paenibacillus alvei]MCY9764970.1 hypothetical protein [Paenibacillus alvei]